MDSERFDRLAKDLGAAASRRRVLLGLGGAVALALGRTLPAAAQNGNGARECKTCNDAAKACRRECREAKRKGESKNACLKTCQATRATCRATCVNTPGGPRSAR